MIYLGGVAGLGTIAETAGTLRLGSLVTHYQLETSEIIRERLPALAETWQEVAPSAPGAPAGREPASPPDPQETRCRENNAEATPQ